MTCHLFLDNFSWNFMTFCSSKVKSLETNLCFKKTRISRFRYHENIHLFWILSFAKGVFIAENWLCFRACNSRIVTCDQEFCHVEWFFLCLLNHLLRNLFLWKVFLKDSWCCRKHVFVFEIVSLKDLNKFDQIIFFPVTFWVKDLFTVMEKVWILFHFGY